MCAVVPLTIAGWQTVIATVLIVAITVGYGELRARDNPPHQPAPSPSGTPEEDNPGARDH